MVREKTKIFEGDTTNRTLAFQENMVHAPIKRVVFLAIYKLSSVGLIFRLVKSHALSTL